MTTTTTYTAETVAELALELRTVSRLSWALTEQNSQLKKQLDAHHAEVLKTKDALTFVTLQHTNALQRLKATQTELDQKRAKIQRLLSLSSTPVSALKLSPGPANMPKRLKCETLADVAQLNRKNIKNSRGYRLIFEAMAEYLEGR